MRTTRILLCLIITIPPVFTALAQGSITLSGIVKSESSNKVLPSVTIYLDGYDYGTVTNTKGEFDIKFPGEYANASLVISSLGYTPERITVSAFENGGVIFLRDKEIILEEIVVQSAEDIIRQALQNIALNYPMEYEALTAFYREKVQRNRNYVDISQGILDVLKQPYLRAGDDQVKIQKGFRSKDYAPQDTLVFKLVGGPNIMLMLDVVKSPGMVLAEDLLSSYRYETTDVTMRDGSINYEISFEPKSAELSHLYTGKIYVQNKSYAITEIQFGYNPKTVETSASYLVRNKPMLAKVTPKNVTYHVKYRELNGKWYLYYVKNELEMKVNWKKKLFNSTFNSTSEMVVTKRTDSPIKSFDRADRMQQYLAFTEVAPKYYDQSFWEEYNIIKPEDDFLQALNKINAKKD
ncbi:MAG: carboxypeptidase-like regulatory domain-containing protein [Cyclobacteriaceae bacterium]